MCAKPPPREKAANATLLRLTTTLRPYTSLRGDRNKGPSAKPIMKIETCRFPRALSVIPMSCIIRLIDGAKMVPAQNSKPLQSPVGILIRLMYSLLAKGGRKQNAATIVVVIAFLRSCQA